MVTEGQVSRQFLSQLVHQPVDESLALARPEAICCHSFQFDCPLDREAFSHAVLRLGDRLLRLKGHVLFSDADGPEFVETVGGPLTIKPAIAQAMRTAFTAIAFGLPEKELVAAFCGLQCDSEGI